MSQAVLDRAPQAPTDALTGEEASTEAQAAPWPRRWRAWLWVLLAPVGVMALIAAVVIPVLGHDGLRPGEAELNASGGRARVQHGTEGRVEDVTGSTRVRTGDIVTAEAGRPSLELPGGVVLTLRGADATSVAIASTPELRAGVLLATTKDHGFTLAVDGTVVTVPAGDAAVRFSRSNATVDVAVYRGQAGIDSAGVKDTVHAFRQVAVTGLRNVDQAFALPVDTSDAWDRQYLAPAIDAQHLIEPLRTSFDGVMGTAPLTAAQLNQALPELPLADDSLASRLGALPQSLDPGGVLVGATIVSLGSKGSGTARWGDVFSFHDDGGATWGLVAMDQGVTPAALNRALQDAVQRLLAKTAPVVAPTSPPTPTTTPTTSPTAGTVPPGNATPVPDGGTGPTQGSGGSSTPTSAPRGETVSPTLPPSPVQRPIITLPPLPVPLLQPSGSAGTGGQGEDGVLQPLLNTVAGLLNGLLR